MKKVLFSLFITVGLNLSCLAAPNATDTYLLAQARSTTELKKTENIDVVNSDGDTALCIAIKYNDTDAYNLLHKAGANTEHECVKNIPTEKYTNFMQKVKLANKPWSFLGMGKWTWGAIGAGVVAGGAAAMGGGSGGGSGGGGNINQGENFVPSEGYTTEPCPAGYYESDSSWHWAGIPGESEKIWYHKCAPVSCSYATTECTGGYVETGNTCQSADIVYKECRPRDCPYPYMDECFAGFHETGSTCQSAGTTYVECLPDACDGYNFTQCPDGYLASASCKSGFTTKYKCDTPVTCPYNTTECTAGYVETGNTCQSGNTLYKECTPVKCPYTTTSCGGGYYETGNTCQSGSTTYVECAYCGKNASFNGKECVCDSGYEDLVDGVGCSLTKLDCGRDAHQSGTSCVCDSGFKDWVEGVGCESSKCGPNSHVVNGQCQCYDGYITEENWYGCQEPKECGNNAHQLGRICTCDAGYEDWVDGVGCRSKCGSNAFRYGDLCKCADGYENWTEGVGCSLTPIDCGSNAFQQGTTCTCEQGYENWQEGGCSLIPLSCGNNAHQEGPACVCNIENSVWIEGVGCFERKDCGRKAYHDGTKCVCEQGYENWQEGIGCSVYGYLMSGDTSKPSSNITINNNSDAYVYGMSSEQNQGRLINNFTYLEGRDEIETQSEIHITNEGNGNLYGMHTNSDVSVINALSDIKGTIVVELDYPIIPIINSSSTGAISLHNIGDGTVYGMYGNSDIYNAYAAGELEEVYTSNIKRPLFDIKAYGELAINNRGDGTVYGMYNGTANAYTSQGRYENLGKMMKTATAHIKIDNIGSGDVYGMFGQNTSNALSTIPYANETIGYVNYSYKTSGYISIKNTGDGNVYGMYGNVANVNSPSVSATGEIKIENYGNGDVYGLYGSGQNVMDKGNGTISILNIGDGNVYGIKGHSDFKSKVHIYDPNDPNSNNSLLLTTAINANDNLSGATGIIDLIYKGHGNSYAMFAEYIKGSRGSAITLTNLSDGNAYGMYGQYINNNKGSITINNLSTGSAFGIFGTENSIVINDGTITIYRKSNVNGVGFGSLPEGTSGDVFGIYVKSGSYVINDGTIDIDTDGTMYGIYAESDSTVVNTGTISLGGIDCNGTYCNNSYSNHIVLNGSSLYNSGAISANSLNLNDMGGTVVAGANSQFNIVNELSGDLNISSDLVMDGNQTTYVAENMIQAGDTSNLNLRSGSAMFDARLADNGNDVVMTMKSFDSLTDNKSLANFLADNYAKGTSAEFFGGLKSGANIAEFNNILNGLSGMNAFTQFDREDMSAMREINFSMNQQMFMSGDRDEYNVSGSMEHFSFSNSSNGGSGSYGISNSRMSDKWKLGYGLAMANIGTSDDFGTNRSNQIGLFYMPMTYTGDDIEFISTPRVGFAKSHYNRRGYNNMNYDGYIEKQIFGFNNDLRYPITFGNWTIAPDLGFNAIMYRQSGHESDQAFSLIIPADEIYSAEAGFGLFTKYERKLDNGSLRFNSGVMVYRELADTYNMKLGIRGLDGTFNLYDGAEHDYSGAATFGFDYSTGRFSLYGNAQYFVDNDRYLNLKGGLSLKF